MDSALTNIYCIGAELGLSCLGKNIVGNEENIGT